MNSFKSMIRYSQRALMLGVLLSSITWVPQVYYSFIHFFSVSLPNTISVAVLEPKWPFIVSNLIVIFLYGETKISKCTMKDERNCMIRNEKVEYLGVPRKLLSDEKFNEENVEIIQENKEEVLPVVEEKNGLEIVAWKEENGAQENGQAEKECEEMEMREDQIKMESEYKELERKEEQVLEVEEKEMEMIEYADKMESEHEELDRDVREEQLEMEVWPAEKFNRKVEDFIAKVNMQIWLEARTEARMAISCY